MIKNILQEIGGVGLYGIISLSLFFTVFCAALLWSLFRGEAFCRRMSALPLDRETREEIHED
ncbi:MAG: CcoQ/FixQ family Cbb3-type cytochrome c oxidase assembly chaperone [Verrucomicrobiota bacterium]|nr:CcoQ/FixQ family Cbb3-type cytochrome c oxidase assembly chaperone [Verrucomicrobiota bacterium]